MTLSESANPMDIPRIQVGQLGIDYIVDGSAT